MSGDIESTGLGIALVAGLLSIATAGSYASSVSASGSAVITGVPVGRDSLFQTEVTGINNTDEGAYFSFTLVNGRGENLTEPIPNMNWVDLAFDTAFAPPEGNTRRLAIEVSLPEDSSLYNRRFGGFIHVGRVSSGSISMAVSLRLLVETTPSRSVYTGVRELTIAPSVAPLNEDWDSLALFNGSATVETVAVYWTDDLRKGPDTGGRPAVEIARRTVLWNIPTSKVVIEPRRVEKVYFRKIINNSIFTGYIVCAGRKKSLYCILTH